MLSHIEELPVGSKLSVRGLAGELGVSEGTVYKAIKDAEARGIVVTRPKAGTFRVDTAIPEDEHQITIAEIAKLLGLTVAAGKSRTDRVINKIIICDSDEEQLLQLLNVCTGENTLCIAGNRPDLQLIVIDYGANLLVTGGSRTTDYLLSHAEKKGVCVANSIQSTYTLIRLLDNQFSSRQRFDQGANVSQWMQTPDYLYYNDIVADWHNFYQHNLSGTNQYPLVDDELNIRGGLDIRRAFAAMPSQRLSELMADSKKFLIVDKDESVHELSKKMILSGNNIAAVMSGNKMDGVIFANDLLRYYMYSAGSDSGFQAEPFLALMEDCSSKERMVYQLRIPENDAGNLPNLEMSIMLAAAGRHAELMGCMNYRVDSGTFYAPARVAVSDGLMLTSSLARADERGCTVEAEIHDDMQSYAKALLMFSKA